MWCGRELFFGKPFRLRPVIEAYSRRTNHPFTRVVLIQKIQLSFAVFFSSCYKEIVGSIYSLLYKSILILDSRRKTAVYLSGKIMNSSASGQLTSFML